MTIRFKNGFTLIELVIAILLIAVLAAVAIPQFQDFRRDARNAATHGSLGGMRAALAIHTAAIRLKEDSSTPSYVTYLEFSANKFNASHPVLNGTAIMDPASGIPENPWSTSAAPTSDRNRIYDCSGQPSKGLLLNPNDDRGWCYNEITGQIWANSDLNGDPTSTENTF